jgi:hypothetical protein
VWVIDVSFIPIWRVRNVFTAVNVFELGASELDSRAEKEVDLYTGCSKSSLTGRKEDAWRHLFINTVLQHFFQNICHFSVASLIIFSYWIKLDGTQLRSLVQLLKFRLKNFYRCSEFLGFWGKSLFFTTPTNKTVRCENAWTGEWRREQSPVPRCLNGSGKW